MQKTSSSRLVVGILILASIGGCGSDPSDMPAVVSDSSPSATAVVGAAAAAASSRDALAVVDLRDAPQGDASYPTVEVGAGDNTFGANAAIRVRPGTEVKWTNTGRNAHDVIPLEPAKQFGVGPQAFAAGAVHEFTFAEPGIYEYFCDIHGSKDKGMVGTVVVGDVDYTPGSANAAADSAPKLTGTIKVPADVPTIQAAIDRAAPGALVLIAPGVYHEAVEVTTPEIVIRGEDRNTTVLDGEFKLSNGFKVLSDGVAIENITSKNYAVNGFFWTGVSGYRGSYLTAVNNGDYGIYAFDSVHGQFDHSYASGSPDSGFYIGQCEHCDAVVTDVVAEYNELGFSGTNSSEVAIVNSLWQNNRAGIVPNSLDSEKYPPVARVNVIGNTVRNNNNGDASQAKNSAFDAVFGVGIVIPGGLDSNIERNFVSGQLNAGIAVAPNPGPPYWASFGNRILDNVIRNSAPGGFDLASLLPEDGPSCFQGNDFKTSAPLNIEKVFPCTGTPAALDTLKGRADLAPYLDTSKNPKGKPYQEQPEPAAQPNMPDALTAPAVPAKAGVVPLKIDLAAIKVPTP